MATNLTTLPKYAHLTVEPDQRIAEATGFGYEWVQWEGTEGAWQVITESEDVAAHLLEAARAYRAAYESWQQLYVQYLGHGVPEEKRKTREQRLAGAEAVRQGLAHEKAAIAEVEHALAALK